MKKLLFLAILLIGFLAQGQNSAATQAILDQVKKSDERTKAAEEAKIAKEAVFNHPNAEYIYSLSKMTETTAREFADRIAFSGKTKREFFIIKENSRMYVIKYIDKNVNAVTRDQILKGNIDCKECMNVSFYIYYKGENKALEIPGVKALKFNDVWGRYLDLFPVWKNVFKPEADIESTVGDYKSKEVIHRPTNVNFKFNESDSQWQILKFY
jgi:hypothetical protein